MGLLIGFLAQRSRFCTVGAVRDLILLRDTHLFNGVVALVVAAFLTNLVLGQFKPGFAGQPIAHTDALWNFGGMVAGRAGLHPGRRLPGAPALPVAAKATATRRSSSWA